MVGPFPDPVCTALGCWAQALEAAATVDVNRFHEEVAVLNPYAFIFALPVCDGRQQKLLEPVAGILF